MPFDGSLVYPLDPQVTARVFERAADYIERGWCSGHFARHLFGWSCSPFVLLARRFCARGALQRALWCEDAGIPSAIEAHEAYLVRSLILAAHGTPVGVGLTMMRGWVAETTQGQRSATDTDMEAIQRWSDSSKNYGYEMAALFRFAAEEARCGA